MIVAEPSGPLGSGASWRWTRAGTSASRTGNSGGERYCESDPDRERVGDGGPQMWSSVPVSQSGAKNPGPPDDPGGDGSAGCRCVSAPCRRVPPRARGSLSENPGSRGSHHRAHLDAGRVPAGADGVRARRGERATRAPEPGAHVRPPRPAPRRRPTRRRADPPGRTGDGDDLEVERRPSIGGLDPQEPVAGDAVRNAVANGRSSSRIGSPDSSTGLNVSRELRASSSAPRRRDCPKIRSAGFVEEHEVRRGVDAEA